MVDQPAEAAPATTAAVAGVEAVAYTPTWLAASDVVTWLQLHAQAAPDMAALDRVCAMTELYVQRCRPEQWVEADPEDPDSVRTYTPDAETYQGAVMYAARETRRRNSPAGTETFAGGGADFVAKYDADIERALRTGTWNRPGVG